MAETTPPEAASVGAGAGPGGTGPSRPAPSATGPVEAAPGTADYPRMHSPRMPDPATDSPDVDSPDVDGRATGVPHARPALSEPRWLERLRSSSGLTRFRRYTWAALWALALFEALLLTNWLASARTAVGVDFLVLLGVLFAAHTAWVARLAVPSLNAYLGTGPRPHRGLAVLLAVTVAALAVLFVQYALGEASGTGAAVVWLLMFAAGPLMTALPLWRGSAVMGALLAGSLLTLAAVGAERDELSATVTGSVCGVLGMAFAYRGSGWSLRIVEQLAAAQEAEARLAVAEERLRFGRDMHDVLGRNLAVIALKSELACQLAERGSPHAVEQMTEVQQIARDSQRELREVVRGYREVNLHTELEGARGVLRAAGVDCRVRDDGGGELPPTTRSALGWVVREATTNVLRHADARTCEIRTRLALTPLDDGPNDALPAADARTDGGAATSRVPGPVVVLVVENDGVPTVGERAPVAAGTAGSGLSGLQERLAPLGGTVRAERPSPGTFRLTAAVPLTVPAQATDATVPAGPGGDVR